MKLFIGNDHAGLELKKQILASFSSNSDLFEIVNKGTDSLDSVDYPDIVDSVCQPLKDIFVEPTKDPLLSHKTFGILICGSGQGVCMRANKFHWIRAALCQSVEQAILSREHNNANVLCLGSRMITPDLAIEIVKTFLSTPFAGDRHVRRVQKLSTR